MFKTLLEESYRGQKVNLEALRILACFLVMYLFTGNMADTVAGKAVFSLAQESSCIFFMISGAVLLDKKESLKSIWIKRVFRISFIIVGISVIILIHRRNFDLFSWLGGIAGNNINPYLEFLYAYAAAMVCLPFLKVLAQNMSSRMYLYLLIIKNIWEIVLYVSRGGGIIYAAGLDFPIFMVDSAFYMLIGFWLENIVDISYSTKYIDIFLSVIVGVMVASYYIVKEQLLYDFVLISIFLLLKMIIKKYPPTKKKTEIICFGGSLTFGIYLLSVPSGIFHKGVMLLLNPIQSLGCISSIIGAVILFFVYGIIVVILKSIPRLGRIVEWFI